MCACEERIKAVKLYNQYDFCLSSVIHEPGYHSGFHARG